jgi:hypothetical protein
MEVVIMNTIIENFEIAEEINETEEKGGFVFFPSFKESIESLPEEQGNKLLRALMKYGIDGIIVDDDPFIRALVVAMKPNIDNSHKQFKKAQERKKKWAKKNGKKDNTDDSSEPENKNDDSSQKTSKKPTFKEELKAYIDKTIYEGINNQQSQYIR